MTRTPLDLGAYALPGRIQDPRPGLAQAVAGEALGLGSIWVAERWEKKEIAATLGALTQRTERVKLVAGMTHFGTRHPIVLAGIGVWLISRTEVGSGRPEGLGMAVLSGVGFAGFYLCAHQAGNASALWIASCSRAGSLLVTAAIVLFGRHLRALPAPVLGIALTAGILDVAGTVVFIRASQIGRLDDAVVISSLYPAITVLLARIFLHEHFSRARTIGMVAALAAVPMIAG